MVPALGNKSVYDLSLSRALLRALSTTHDYVPPERSSVAPPRSVILSLVVWCGPRGFSSAAVAAANAAVESFAPEGSAPKSTGDIAVLLLLRVCFPGWRVRTSAAVGAAAAPARLIGCPFRLAARLDLLNASVNIDFPASSVRGKGMSRRERGDETGCGGCTSASPMCTEVAPTTAAKRNWLPKIVAGTILRSFGWENITTNNDTVLARVYNPREIAVCLMTAIEEVC